MARTTFKLPIMNARLSAEDFVRSNIDAICARQEAIQEKLPWADHWKSIELKREFQNLQHVGLALFEVEKRFKRVAKGRKRRSKAA